MKTLYLNEKSDELYIIDQTLLPGELKYISVTTPRGLFEAIKTLKVRGAPAIGVAAALGVYACAARIEDTGTEGFLYTFEKICSFIASSRPTARNLFYALERMQATAALNRQKTKRQILKLLKDEALDIYNEDIKTCRQIGGHGADLLKDGDTLLTHCNAGSLCAVEYGTALAPVYIAQQQGKKIKVYADETRPLMQGARLTAFELVSSNIDTTVICDNMAASLMSSGLVDIIIVGCDRLAMNGDFANKIGTLSLAINAGYFKIPFYVAVPSSTLDRNISSGSEIEIEQRDGREVSEYWFSGRMTPEGAGEYNPAFDVTPCDLVTGYITEKGIITDINDLLKQ